MEIIKFGNSDYGLNKDLDKNSYYLTFKDKFLDGYWSEINNAILDIVHLSPDEEIKNIVKELMKINKGRL